MNEDCSTEGREIGVVTASLNAVYNLQCEGKNAETRNMLPIAKGIAREEEAVKEEGGEAYAYNPYRLGWA